MDWLISLLLSDPVPSGTTLAQTAWSFRAVPAWWALVPLAIVLITGSIWFYRQEKLTTRARWCLIGCRLLVCLCVVTLICRPTLEATLQSTRARPVVILLDNSLSMALADPRSQAADKLRVALAAQLYSVDKPITPHASLSEVPEKTPEQLSRADLVKLLLTHPQLRLIEKLQAKGPVQLKLFGQGLTSTQLVKTPAGTVTLEGYTTAEAHSAMGDAIHSLLNVEAETDLPAAFIVLSDGLEQGSLVAPEQAMQQAQQRGVPVHTVGIGSPDWAYLQVKSLTVPEAIFLDDTVTAQLHWRAQGLKSLPLNVTLTLGDIVVAKKEYTGRNHESILENISFAVPKNIVTDGPIDLRVLISGPALEDAPIPQIEWNQRVRLIDRQVRVLLIDHMPRFETKFLMSALLRDRRVEAHVHFSANDPAGMLKSPFEPAVPITRAELFHYDLIILGDVNPETWGTEKLTWLRDLIRDGGGLVILSGKRFTPAGYSKTPLAEVIPVEGPAEMPAFNEALATELYQPQLTPVGQRHEMLALADEAEENLKLWNELPGFYGVFPAQRLRPGAISLLVHPTLKSGTVPLPLMAMQRYGRGQVLYLGTDETWRWRADSGEKHFARFWGQVVYQLGLPRLLGGARRVQLSFDRTTHLVGQPSFLYVRAYDQDYQPLHESKLSAKVLPLDRTGKPSGEPPTAISLEAIPGQPGDYRALLNNEVPGRFMIMIESPEAGQLPFHVDYPPNDERIPAPMAMERMKSWSQLTGGRFCREEDLLALPDQVKAQEGSFQYRRDVVLWNPLALVLLSLLLGAEWILRKLTNLS